MRRLNKWLRYLIYVFATFAGLFTILVVYLLCVALAFPPEPEDLSSLSLERKQIAPDCYVIGNNWIRKSNSGLWEMYIEGAPFERGVINGKLSKELVYAQEKAFSDQIAKIVPSSFYRGFLKYFIAWFNRDLEKNLTEEQKLEIFGVSRSASPEFDYVGSAYQRMMNYHAAHDIGHALQNLALVGCSSFATWDQRSEDSLLIIGRNFDFYAGDRFAEDKIVEFCKPASGHRFMMVTWGGMTGVLSGMNMEGLTVTINAAKSKVPGGAATPISLLSREILQYASNISEAVAIAGKRKTFVSESILIGSAKDDRAVIIEKTPEALDVYASVNGEIICTNHYQSNLLSKEDPNIEQMDQSASVYRYKRITELLERTPKNTPERTASILRDQLGLHDAFIGLGNEKAVNQLMSHHSIIFEPQKKLVWVSSSPWQLGKYIAYNLDTIFAMQGLGSNHEICESSLTIGEDPFLNTKGYTDYMLFKKLKNRLSDKQDIDVDELIGSNPEYFGTYVLVGDYLARRKDCDGAMKMYEKALTKVIATKGEESYIRKQMAKCNKGGS